MPFVYNKIHFMPDFKNTKYKNIEEIDQKDILIKKESIEDLKESIKISWANPRITDFDYPLNDSLLGKWEVQVLRTDKKMKFEDIFILCKQDGYEPATVYHLLNFIREVKNLSKYKSLMAPGSLCIDDFEYTGCVVFSNSGATDLKLGLGNWRGSKIGEYDILRVKKQI